MSIRKPPHELELDEWSKVIDTNLTSAFLCSKAAYPALKASGHGKIINIGSMMSIFGASFAAAYAASKGGIVQYTRACANAWAPDNIQVNAILPGWIDTDLTEGARQQVTGLHERGARAHAGGTLGRDRRFCRHRRIPGLAGVGFRHRHRDPGRRRLFGHGLRHGGPAGTPGPFASLLAQGEVRQQRLMLQPAAGECTCSGRTPTATRRAVSPAARASP